MENECFIRLETERLLLRHFELSDADVMFKNWASDPDVNRFLPFGVCRSIKDTYTRIEQWLDYFKKNGNGSWELFVIELKSTNEVIGTIDYAELDTEARSAEVGYQIGKAWWGLGYVAEALQALMKHGFETIGLKRIWADYDSRNPNSGKVMAKSGMCHEKTTLQSQTDSGEEVSRIQYAIMAEDYFRKAKLLNDL